MPRKAALERSGRARSNSLFVCSATWVRGASALVASARVDENIVAESPSNEWGAFRGAEPPETRPKVVPARRPEAKPGPDPGGAFPAPGGPGGTVRRSAGLDPAQGRLLERSSLYLNVESLISHSSSSARPMLPKRWRVGPIWVSKASMSVFGNLIAIVLPINFTSIVYDWPGLNWLSLPTVLTA